MIEAKELTKEFLIPVKQPGMRGAIRQLIHGEYQRKVAVDHVNFKVEQGEAVAYIGPNGAGKSTTIKMLTGILKPSSDEILINGRDPKEPDSECQKYRSCFRTTKPALVGYSGGGVFSSFEKYL